MTKAGLFFRTAVNHSFTKIDSKWVKLRVLIRQHSISSRDYTRNDVGRGIAAIEDIIPDNTVDYNHSILTISPRNDLSTLSILLSEPG
jgi:hypothetical protein